MTSVSAKPVLRTGEPIEVKYGDRVLAFDPVEHAYYLDGRRLKSVTQMLKEAGYCRLYHGNGDAATKGRYVHEATLYDDMGELDEDTLDPGLLGYVQAWRAFRTERRFYPRIDLCEQPCFDPLLMVGGTPDSPGTVGMNAAVVEKKSGAECAWHQIQAVSYTQMLARHHEEFKQAETWLVYLKSNGSHKAVQVTDKRLGALFTAICSTVNGKEFYADR